MDVQSHAPSQSNATQAVTQAMLTQAMLLEAWRTWKALRTQVRLETERRTNERPHLTDETLASLQSQSHLQKRFLYNNYLPKVTQMASDFMRKKLPKKSLLLPQAGLNAVHARLWNDMELFDPDYAPESDWLRPDSNIFMQWFNSSKAKDGSNRSRIVGAIWDAARQLQHFPRKTPKQVKDFNERMERLLHKLHKSPTIEEYLDEYGWDRLDEIRNPLLFSQVFNQSNTATGEHESSEELRFEGDKRLNRNNERSAFVPGLGMPDVATREKRVMELIPDSNCQLPVIARHFWGWTLGTIADALGISFSRAAKRVHLGEDLIAQALGSREAAKKFLIQGDDPSKSTPTKPTTPITKPTTHLTFSFPQEND